VGKAAWRAGPDGGHGRRRGEHGVRHGAGHGAALVPGKEKGSVTVESFEKAWKPTRVP
jgi:hypothetical protein